MKVDNLKINHITRPMGYWYRTLTASWKVKEALGKFQQSAQIQVSSDEDFKEIIWDSGRDKKLKSTGTEIPISLEACTRYYWKVKVWDETGDIGESNVEWFETGLMERGFKGISITPTLDSSIAPVYEREFELDFLPQTARMYITCLGVYELEINGERVDDHFLEPGFTVYESYVQYQTYDIRKYLCLGKNQIKVIAGDGWYKGLYGYRQNENYRKGKKYEFIADVYADGECILCTDLSWKSRKNKILYSDLYDGEIYDANLDDSELFDVEKGNLDKKTVMERIGVPVKIVQTLRPKEIIHTPKGETVLDMGQNMAGYVSFYCAEPKGTHIILEHGEILQNGCFFNKNYRTAKARYEYISDGIPRVVHARLCFFGFQYVKISGIKDVRLEDFLGNVLCSELETTIHIETGHQLLNRLIQNVMWSQKGNFIDIPTDCPQRDEKMGWTGDAQIFSQTACMNMDCYPFFRKYLHDISLEQELTGGLVPQIVPSVGRRERTSAAWGDAAVIIPWNMYQIYGDSGILKEQYESMTAWIAYIDEENRKSGTNPDLWQNGFHYGDWLALDGGCYHMPTGGTDVFYISSAYFYYSVQIMCKTAEIIGKKEEQNKWKQKAEKIRQAIKKEYFTGNGKVAIDTQTACIVALCFKIVSGKETEPVKKQFLKRMQMDGWCLKTGFVGTPFLLEALTLCEREDLAYRVLLDKNFPSWLYPVTMGATTMWERWDAINPDGSMSDDGMNSLNHYANGSVAIWIYEHIGGIRQLEDTSGFEKVMIAPVVTPEISYIKMEYDSMSGKWKINWHIEKAKENERFILNLEIPFNTEAVIRLPYVDGEVKENGKNIGKMEEPLLKREAGKYQYEYTLNPKWKPCYSMEDSVCEMVRNPELKKWLYAKVPMLEKVDGAEIQNMTLIEMSKLPFFLGIGMRLGLDQKTLQEIQEHISKIEKFKSDLKE